MEKITIRPANIDDFKKVFSLLKELWPKYGLDIKIVRHIFSGGIVNNFVYYFVAQKNSKIIGFISLSIINGLQQGKIATIDEFIVSRENRRQGVGKNMFNYVELFAKNKNCKSLELHSGLSRKKSHLFYESNGFEKVSYYFCKKIG